MFLLAFADGSAAVYDASLMFQKGNTGEQIDRSSESQAGAEVGSIKRLHVIVSKSKKHTIEDGNWLDDLDGTSIQAEAASITAVALVPGRRALAVTVGADGKCCVVDFTQPTREKALLLNSWHLRRPATSVSVVYSKLPAQPSQLDGTAERDTSANKDCCIAVGRQDGKVLLFDLGGKPLGKQILDPKGARVVDVEWARKEVDAAFAQTGLVIPCSQKSVPKRKSLETEVIGKGSSEDTQLGDRRETVEKSTNHLSDCSNNSPSQAINHLDLPHTFGPQVRNLIDTIEVRSGQAAEVDDSQNSPLPSSSSTSLLVEFSTSPPPIPPRPTPKPGGKLSERRSMTARGPQSQPSDFEPNAVSNNRRKTANDITPTKLPVPTAPPARNNLFGPHTALDVLAKSWKPRSRSPPTHVSSTAYHDHLRGFRSSHPEAEDAASTRADTTSHNESPRLADIVNSQLDPPSGVPKPLSLKPSMASLRSYKSASSQLDMSENSADTVIDWSVSASSRRLHPSIHEPSPVRASPQRSFLPERPPNNGRRNERSKMKKNEHDSIDVSTQVSPSSRSSVSQISRYTSSADPIVHWPNLKKSPLITDLRSGIESATASVLDLGVYTEPPSPAKAKLEITTSPKNIERHSSSSRKDRYIPPRLPLKVSPNSNSFRGESTTHICACESHLQATIMTSLESFRREMDGGFKAQRLWLEDLVRGKEQGGMKLEEENKMLRAEILRTQKGKGRAE